MTNQITAAGYIVRDNEGIIHGFGPTEDAAWADMLNTMSHANIRVVDAGENIPENDSWTYADNLRISPATAALLALVSDAGGACSWGRRAGVACTVAEEEA